MKTLAMSVIVVAALISCAMPNASGGESELHAAIAAYRAALNAGDSAAFFAFFSPDVEVLAPGSQPLRGAAVRDMFRPLFTEVRPDLAPFTNEELTVSGDVGVQRYSYQLTTTPKAGGAATTEVGSGLHIWRRTGDGRWLVAKDIWTNPPKP